MAINIIEGNVVNEGMKVGIVCARFNEFITAKLLGGAVDALRRHNVPEEDVTAAWVPGAFEIPVTAKRMAAKRQVRRGHLPGRGHPRRNVALRRGVQRGVERHRAGAAGNGRARDDGRADRRHHRAGYRTRGHESR